MCLWPDYNMAGLHDHKHMLQLGLVTSLGGNISICNLHNVCLCVCVCVVCVWLCVFVRTTIRLVRFLVRQWKNKDDHNESVKISISISIFYPPRLILQDSGFENQASFSPLSNRSAPGSRVAVLGEVFGQHPPHSET